MKPSSHLRRATATLLTLSVFLSPQVPKADLMTEQTLSVRVILQTSVDAVRIVQAAMPAYDRVELPYAPHKVIVSEHENDDLHYYVSFWPKEVDIVGHLLTVVLNKESLEIVRVIGPDDHVR